MHEAGFGRAGRAPGGVGPLRGVGPRAIRAAAGDLIQAAARAARATARSRSTPSPRSQAKGLEFDRVILVDPAGVVAQSPNGGHDLYVAITRATHRLTVVHEGDLPASLASLAPTD